MFLTFKTEIPKINNRKMRNWNRVLFLISLIILSSAINAKTHLKKGKPKKHFSSFLQTRQQYKMSTKKLSDPDGCFFGTPKELIEIIEEKIEKYKKLCDIENRPAIQQLIDLSKKLGSLQAKLIVNPDHLITLQEKIKFTESSFDEVSTAMSASTITSADIEKIMFTTLKESFYASEEAKTYPSFMKDKAWILARYAYAKNYLESGFEDKNSCVEVSEQTKKIVDVLNIDINEELPPLKQKNIIDKVIIDPKGFEYGGYAVAFWVKEDMNEIKDVVKLISGFNGNEEKLNFRLQCCKTNHYAKIGNEDYSIIPDPQCSQYAFVLISFQKDCDSYSVKMAVRFSQLNQRFEIKAKNITQDVIENLQLTINSEKVINPIVLTHYDKSEENELRVLSLMTDSFFQPILTSLNQCQTLPPENCDYYSITEGCINCPEKFLLFDKKCYATCPDGTYKVNTYSCESCPEGCSSCNELKCKTCEEGFYFVPQSGKCVKECPKNLYPKDGVTCETCTENCRDCKDSTSCAACATGKVLFEGKCIDQCPDGTYLEITNGISECKSCDEKCSSCTSYKKCTDCKSPNALYQDKCQLECPEGYRKDTENRKCVPCSDFCAECNAEKCEKCTGERNLSPEGTCIEKCPEGTTAYKNVCIDCGDKLNCKICESTNINKCTKCTEDKVLLTNYTCSDQCGNGYYADENKECKQCNDKSCDLCTADSCLKCKDGFYKIYDSKCVSSCPDGFIPIGDTCTQCTDEDCKKCNSTDLSVCTECYYPKQILKEGKCVEECDDFYYQDDKAKECKHCREGCQICNDQFTCDACEEGYYYLNGICLKECPKGYRIKDGSQCEKCSILNCESCPTEATICKKCMEPKVLYNNVCYDKCPSGSFLPLGTKTCKDCSKNCGVCIDENTCIGPCLNGFYLQDEVCVPECNDGFYVKDNTCTECTNKNCKKCNINPGKCTSCQEGQLLSDGDCVKECPEGTFESGGQCLKCSSKCKTCVDSANQCTSCAKGLVFDVSDPDLCVGYCNQGSVPVNGVCTKCADDNCALCSDKNIECCTVPVSPFVVHDCDVLDKCPDGFREVEQHCEKCQDNCKQCPTSASQCTLCKEGFYEKDGKCVSDCGNSYIEINGKCVACSSSCNKCKSENLLCCTKCPFGKLLLDCDCVSSCPEGYYEQDSECRRCADDRCSTCDLTGQTCTKCSQGYVLYNEKCIPLPCPEGTSNVNGVCQSCLIKGCKQCDISTQQCDACFSNKVLIDVYICDDQCPNGSHKIQAPGKENEFICEKCISNCNQCEDASSCKTCASGYVLQGAKCQKECDEGFYAENGVCVACSFPDCAKCTRDDCLKCKDDLYLREVDNTCVEKCIDRTYPSESMKQCIDCPIHCSKCTDENSCTECDSPYVLLDGKCKDECPKKYISIKGVCQECNTDPKCNKCAKDLTTCEECQPGYNLMNNKCVDKCDEGYYALNGVCTKCIDFCKYCSNGKQCEECIDNFNLYNDLCTSTCPEGTYSENKKCINCIANCALCDNGEKCNACKQGFYLENGICVASCSVGYYKANDHECKECSENCIACSNEKTCDTCAPGLYRSNGVCVEKCPSGQLPIGQDCASCVSSCYTCGTHVKECFECEEGYNLYNQECIKNCPAGYYSEDKTCKQCIENCDKCKDSSSCEVCSDGYALFEGKCVSDCPNGYGKQGKECVKCGISACGDCSTTIEVCNSCQSGYLSTQDGKCVSSCPPGTYKNANGDKCISCPTGCKLCIEGGVCTNCAQNLYLQGGKCVTKCETGKVKSGDKCVDCADGNCAKCESPSTSSCISCKPGYYLKDKNCVTECGKGYYVDTKTNQCVQCGSNCQVCNDSNTCTQCSDGFVLQGTKCQEKCDDFYVERNTVCNKCTDGNCLICDPLDLGKCTKCNPPFNLYDNACVAKCPKGYHDTLLYNNKVCEKCIDNCVVCVNELYCESCDVGFYLQNGKCVKKCDSGYAAVGNTCKACGQTDCEECSPNDLNQCVKCKEGKFLDKNSHCVEQCGDGYLGLNGSCVKCPDTNCRKCSNYPQCEVCYNGFYLHEGSCLKNCPAGYFVKENGECSPCDDVQNCQSCVPLEPKKCKKCSKGYLYHNICVPNCPEGTFPNANRQCEECSNGCNECSNEDICTSCQPPMFLNGTSCVDECGDFKVGVNNVCKDCGDKVNCVSCDSKDIYKCNECAPGTYLYKGKCLDQCPDGTFKKSKTCEECEANCKECTNNQICTKCYSPFIEFKNDCVENCPVGYVEVDGRCEKCSNNRCEKCSSHDLTQCKKCTGKYILYQGQCISSCPPGLYYDSADSQCKECSSGCGFCQNANSCDVCDEDHILYPVTGECVTQCPDKYYPDYIEDKCMPCLNPSCKTCCASNPSKCLKCPDDSFEVMVNNIMDCTKSCPKGTYQEGNKCIACTYPCKECDANTCSQCESPYKLLDGSCQWSCPEGYTDRDGVCYKCRDENCLVCENSNLDKCQKCNNSTILFNNECIGECPEHYYLKASSENVKSCVQCPTNCDSCTEEGCNACSKGYYFYESTTDCVECHLPKMIINGICTTCKVDGCSICKENQPNECEKCTGNLLLFNSTCISKCPNGYYPDSSECKKCEEGCEVCSSEDKCEKCTAPLVVLNGKCQDKCPTGYRVTNEGSCERCKQENCLACSESSEICEECKGIPLYNGVCVEKCPEGTAISNNTCTKCPNNCLECDSTQCFKCAQGRFIKENKCVSDCGEGYYNDGTNCLACVDKNCLSCSSKLSCDKCKPGTYLDTLTGSCETACPEGFYGDAQTGNCEKCKQGCKRCKSQEECYDCLDSFSFYNDECVSPCPEATTSVRGKCISCTQSDCVQCAPGDPDTCIKCNKYIHNEVCVEECPKGTYLDPNNACKDCDAKCKDCESADTCKECKSEFVLEDGKCLSKCAEGKVNKNGVCVPCGNENCKICTMEINECVDCYKPYIAYEGSCLEECPKGTYQDKNTNKCEKCDSSCEECDSNECKRCRPGYYMHLGQCLTNCPFGYFEDCATAARKCAKCDPSCDGCVLGSSSDCVSCKEGYVLHHHSCVSTSSCPSGTFYDGLKCQECSMDYCAECSSKDTCDRCQNGFTLTEKGCVMGDTITPIISDYILVDSYTADNDTLSAQESFNINDYKATGVGSNVVTFSFYFRSLQPYLAKNATILRVNNNKNSGYSFNYIIEKTKDGDVCRLTITCHGLEHYTDPVDCSYNEINEWMQVIISITKLQDGFTYDVTTYKTANEEKKTTTLNMPLNSRTTILEPNALIVLNPVPLPITSSQANPSHIEFQIGKFFVMDYISNKTNGALLNELPSNCDYFCQNCDDVCKMCFNGILPEDNKCPGQAITEETKMIENPKDYSIHLREYLKNRITSDAYGFTQWFFIKDVESKNEFVLYQITIEKNGDPEYIKLYVKNGHLFLNENQITKEKLETLEWYFIAIRFKKERIAVFLKGVNSETLQQSVTSVPFRKLYDDCRITVHTGNTNVVNTVYNTKIYLNNEPSKDQMNTDYNSLKCSSNCEKCGADFKCIQCGGGFVLSDGDCVEFSPDETSVIELENMVDIWNKETKKYSISENLTQKNITIALNIRKKTHSNLFSTSSKNKFNLISFSDSNGNVEPLLTEELQSEYVSQYSIYGNSLNWNHNYTDEYPDFIILTILVNDYAKTITFIIDDVSKGFQKTQTEDFKGTIDTLILGDDNGYEINTEFSNVRMFDGYVSTKIQANLQQYPNFCPGICSNCDFSTGKCKVCSNYQTTDVCKALNYMWNPAYLFGYNQWSTSLASGSFSLSKYHNVNINAINYIFDGQFTLFNFIEGARYRLGCVKNDQKKLFSPIENRGKEVICLEANIKNSMATLTLRVNDGGKFNNIAIKNFSFSEGKYVDFVAGILGKEKKLYYDFVLNDYKNSLVRGEYNFKYYPEKIQESGAIDIFGTKDDINREEYAVPHVNFYLLRLSPNKDYTKDLIESLIHKETEPICEEGCTACVSNKDFSGACYECDFGYDKTPVSKNSNTVKCTKSKYKNQIYTGEFITKDTEYKIIDKSIVGGDYSIYAHFRLNHPYYNSNVETTILQAGDISIVLKLGRLSAKVTTWTGSQYLDISASDVYNKWYHVLITITSSSIIVTTDPGSGKSSRSIWISPSAPKSIKVKPLGTVVSFYSFGFTSATTLSAVKQADPVNSGDCGVDCALCQNGVCLICGENGIDKDQNKCKGGKISLLPGYYNSGDYGSSLNVFGKKYYKYIRMTQASAIFNFNFEASTKDSNKILAILNQSGNEMIKIFYTTTTGALKITFSPVSGSEVSQTKTLPTKPGNHLSLTIALSFDLSTKVCNLVFGENSKNYLSVKLSMGGFLGYLTSDTTVTFYGKATKVVNPAFYYDTFKSASTLEEEFKEVSQTLQKDCAYGSDICNDCSTGKLKNGVCTPSDTSVFNDFYYQIKQINTFTRNLRIDTGIDYSEGNSINFMLRMTSVSEEVAPILRLTTTFYNLFTIDYQAKDTSIIVSSLESGDIAVFSNVFKDVENLFDWYHFSFVFNKNEMRMIVLDKDNKVVFNDKKTLLLPAPKQVSQIKMTLGYSTANFEPFEISGLGVYGKELTTEEIEKFKISKVDESKVGCQDLLYGVCQQPIDDELSYDMDVYGQKGAALLEVFDIPTAYYSYGRYLITFQVDIKTLPLYNNGVLFLLTSNRNYFSLAKTDPVPEALKNSSLYIGLEGQRISINIPKDPRRQSKEGNKWEIEFSETIKSNIVFDLLVDSEKQTFTIVISYENDSFIYNVPIDENLVIPRISLSSLIYGNSALQSLRINLNSPIVDSSYSSTNSPSSGYTEQCVSKNGENICSNCKEGFRIFKEGCKSRLLS